MDGADVCRTSSRASRRPPDVISTIAILNPRWRRRKWRHPGPGARFSIPIEEWGGKWRPFRFRSPSWVTSFVGTGNEVIQDGRRKRKGRHFPPHSSMGIEKRALYYWWRYKMETFSALLTLSAGNSPVTGEFPRTKACEVELWCFLWSAS